MFKKLKYTNFINHPQNQQQLLVMAYIIHIFHIFTQYSKNVLKCPHLAPCMKRL